MKNETTPIYPYLDAAVAAESSPIVQRFESILRELDRISQTGSARERERARAASLAYARALDLYRRLVELRDAAGSNMRGGTAITH